MRQISAGDLALFVLLCVVIWRAGLIWIREADELHRAHRRAARKEIPMDDGYELALAKEVEDFQRLAKNARIESYRRLWKERANRAAARLAALRADKEAAAKRQG